MARPAVSEWEYVFGFSDDPTPGDAEVLGQLARSYCPARNVRRHHVWAVQRDSLGCSGARGFVGRTTVPGRSGAWRVSCCSPAYRRPGTDA